MKHVNLDIYRVVYVSYLLAVAPRWLNPDVGALPPQMFVAPLGVHWWLSSAPAPGVIVAVEFIRWAALVLVLLKLMPRAASLVAFAAWFWLGGVESGFGKIDHDLIMAAPLLAFAAFGWEEPSPRGVYVVAALVSSFFFTAGLIKLFSGWLNFKASAVEGILHYYEAVYGRDSRELLALPFAFFKTLDIATVALECSFVFVRVRAVSAAAHATLVAGRVGLSRRHPLRVGHQLQEAERVVPAVFAVRCCVGRSVADASSGAPLRAAGEVAHRGRHRDCNGLAHPRDVFADDVQLVCARCASAVGMGVSRVVGLLRRARRRTSASSTFKRSGVNAGRASRGVVQRPRRALTRRRTV